MTMEDADINCLPSKMLRPLPIVIEGSEFAFKSFASLRCIECHLVEMMLDALKIHEALKANLEPSTNRTRSEDYP